MFVLLRVCMAGFKRVGIHPEYVHVDMDDKRKQNCYWVYKVSG
jgi:hypothetical protein